MPVLAMADGFPSIEKHRASTNTLLHERLRRSFAVGYSGDFKAIVGVSDGIVHSFNVVQDPLETIDLGDGGGGDRGLAVGGAREAAASIARGVDGAFDPVVQDRLRSWGYL